MIAATNPTAMERVRKAIDPKPAARISISQPVFLFIVRKDLSANTRVAICRNMKKISDISVEVARNTKAGVSMVASEMARASCQLTLCARTR
jgi:hypothetical protein